MHWYHHITKNTSVSFLSYTTPSSRNKTGDTYVALVHRVERLVDLGEVELVGDEFVHLDLLLHVLVHKRGHTVAALEATEGAASPATARHELERTSGQLHARSGNADDARLAPALVAALKRSAHGLRATDTLERVVQAAEALLLRHLNEHLLERTVGVVLRVDELGGAELLGDRELLGVDVDGDPL
ncbi:hypothetical protein ON010_g10585 [Phytophthora cinnamomi]|nr:hypothetical protein ON010_g10585 [Phytophthora cinnamomi]